MIDRLEMFTSLRPTMELVRRYSGATSIAENKELRTEFSHLDRIAFNSKLVREDEDIRELRTIDTNALYKNVLVEKIVADTKEREGYDDPVMFLVMANPRYKKEQCDRFKIVCNPSTTPLFRLTEFLRRYFRPTANEAADGFFFSRFRLGRADFCVDVETHTVEELRRTLLVDRRLRSHLSLYDRPEEESPDGWIRVWSTAEPETVYIGKSTIMIRIYNKVKEAKHQIQVCKAKGWKISDRVQAYADRPRLTRIEIQIRDLGRIGVDQESGELDMSYGFFQLQTFDDLLQLGPETCDMFSLLRWRHLEELEEDLFGRDRWIARAFNALIDRDGLSQTMMQLPRTRRTEFRQKLVGRVFPHNLNKICHQEIRRWIAS